MHAITEKPHSTLVGMWHNQHGSEINLMPAADGRVTGVFRLKAPGSPRTEEYPLVGFVKQDILAFAVDFGSRGSMTTWVGHHDSSTDSVETIWQMVTDPHGDPEKSWRAILTGSDSFVRGARPESFQPSTKAASHPPS